MRIVNRKVFLSLPENTVYSEYKPCSFGPLSIKGKTCGSNDFYTISINDAIKNDSTEELMEILFKGEKNSNNILLDFDYYGRDGLFDDDQLFAVWNNEDIKQLIETLVKCIK